MTNAAVAQTFTLSGASGNSCNYSSMAVTPSGNFTVNCASATPPVAGEAGTFSLSSATLALTNGSPGSVTVNRTVGTTDSVNVSYTITGGGCTNVSNGVASFGNGSAASSTISITTLAVGTCTVQLGSATVGGTVTPAPNAPVMGSPQSTAVTVSAASSGGGGSGTCSSGQVPALDNFATALGGMGGLDYIALNSGKTASFLAPVPSPGRIMVQLGIGETTSTAAGTLLEWSISKCPGYIDTSLPLPCYSRSYVQNWNSVIIIHDGQGVIDEATAIARKWCWAPAAQGPYYVTVRYTYPPAAYPSRFVYQFQNGGY